MTTTDKAEAIRSAIQARFREIFQATARFSKLDREKERNLYGRKWFDYRFLSPIAATARFYVLYQDVYRWKYSATIDSLEAEKKPASAERAHVENRLHSGERDNSQTNWELLMRFFWKRLSRYSYETDGPVFHT
jgi:hypothetical protein